MYPAAHLCGAILLVIFTVVGFTGNLVTAIILLRDRKIRQHSTTAFIISLAISDLIFSSFSLPVSAAAYLNKDLMTNHIICKLHGATFMINFATTTSSIAAIAINRYILIVHNSLYKSFYVNCSVVIQLLIIWLLPIGFMAFPIFDKWGTIGKNRELCKIMEKDGHTPEDFLFVIGIIIPSIIISVLYACIYCKVRQQSRNMSPHISIRSTANENRLTMMTLLIFISFLLCCFPAVIDHFFFIKSNSQWPNVIAATFGSLISIVDPFIYAATNRKYRAAYYKLFSDMKVWCVGETKHTRNETN